MIADQYVFSETIGFANGGITIHLWGPSNDIDIKNRLIELKHMVAEVDPTEATVFKYVYSCKICRTPVAKILDDRYFGSLLENACSGKK